MIWKVPEILYMTPELVIELIIIAIKKTAKTCKQNHIIITLNWESSSKETIFRFN